MKTFEAIRRRIGERAVQESGIVVFSTPSGRCGA
jgi:hypothetical protein